MPATRATRRRFLKEGVTLAGVAVAARSVSGQTLGEGRLPGDSGDIMAHGERSRYVTTKRMTMSQVGHMDMHGDPKGLDAMTPLGELSGIITPADLHYVSQHSNAPEDIDPSKHRLIIDGMVDRPLVFSMDELKRLPFVSRIHYIECIANRPSRRDKTLEEAAGMIACSEWTGVPLSVLLKEAGVRGGATWILAEGADRITLGTCVPLGKAMNDTNRGVRPKRGARAASERLSLAARGPWLRGEVPRQVAEARQGRGQAVRDILGTKPLHELPRRRAHELLPRAGAEIDHHLSVRRWTTPQRARVLHD